MKPGKGLVWEENLRGPALPLFDRFAGSMWIEDGYSFFVVKLHREQFPDTQWPPALSDSKLDINAVHSQSSRDAGANVEAAHLSYQHLYTYPYFYFYPYFYAATRLEVCHFQQ